MDNHKTQVMPQINLQNNVNINNHDNHNLNPSSKGQYGSTSIGFKGNKKDDFYIFNQPDKKNIFGYENEKLQDSILKLKKELNQKSKEMNILKVELNLLSQENKKKIKVIEDILSSSGKSFDEIVDILDGQSKADKIDLTVNSVIKLREIYVINFLKNQIGQLKTLMNERDEEIARLKSNTKIQKFCQIEQELKIALAENEQIKRQYEALSLKNENLSKSLKDLQEEHQSLFKKYVKRDREAEKLIISLSKMEEDNKILVQEKRKSNEALNKYKTNMISIKADLKHKNDSSNQSKNLEDENSKLVKDKEALNKKIDEISKQKQKLKLEIK